MARNENFLIIFISHVHSAAGGRKKWQIVRDILKIATASKLQLAVGKKLKHGIDLRRRMESLIAIFSSSSLSFFCFHCRVE